MLRPRCLPSNEEENYHVLQAAASPSTRRGGGPGWGGLLFLLAQRLPYRFENPSFLLEDLKIPEPKHSESLFLEPCGPLGVTSNSFGVLAAVQLNNQLF